MAAKVQNVDFSNVKDGGGSFSKKRVKEADYLAKIVKVEDAKAKDDVFQYLFTIKLENVGNASYPYYCKLQDNQLWKLRNLFIAGGKSVPKSRTKVDPNILVGKVIGVTMQDAEYNNQEQSEIAAVFPASELEGDEPTVEDDDEGDEDVQDVDLDDDEPEVEVEDDAEEEVDPAANLDRTALKAAIKEYQADFVAKKSQSDEDLADILRALASPAPDEADGEEDDEEIEVEPEPAPKRTTRKTTAKKPTADDIDDDELEEIDIDDM